MISDGFCPYLTKELIFDVNQSRSPLNIHYDETSTAQVVKQMNFRFWSVSKNQVERGLCTSLMFGHVDRVATAMIDKIRRRQT